MNLGDTFGRFTVFGKIGVGGMGTVFAAFDHEILDFVAIKTLIAEYNDDAKAVQRFQREAQLYSRLNHQNIVGFVETGEEHATHFIALEYIRGHSLADIIDTRRKEVLTFDRSVNLIVDVAKALKQVHSFDILHRDIKPSNIILTQDDTVKLLDFGIALTEDGLDLTGTGMIVGTFVYSSPEQNQGRILDERSDLYALGCVFFEMLTGQRALPGNSMTEVAKFQALPALASPSNFNPNVPPELDAIVNKLLKPRPRDRYQDADELLAALEELKQADRRREGQHYFGDEIVEAWEMAKEAFILGHLDQSIQQTTFYLAQRPMDAKAHFLLGKLYAQKKLPFNATESFGQAIELAPDEPDYRLDFALALYRLEMFRQCVEQCEYLLQKEPTNCIASGLHMLASYHHHEEKQRQAAEDAAAASGGQAPPVLAGAAGGFASTTVPSLPVAAPPAAMPPPPAGAAAGVAPPPPAHGGAPPPAPSVPAFGAGPSSSRPHSDASIDLPLVGMPVAGARHAQVPQQAGDSMRDTIPFDAQQSPPPGPSYGQLQEPPPAPMEGRQTIPFGAAHRRGMEERTKAHADIKMAGRAKLLSSLIPGLGHLYCGQYYQFIRRLLTTGILIAGAAGSGFLSYYEGPIEVNRLLALLAQPAPEVYQFLADLHIESFVRIHREKLFPAAAAFFTMAFLLHWIRSRNSAYRTILRKSLRGKVLHCRDDGTVKINLGSLRGVELGMRFVILHGVAKKEYSVDKTVSRRKDYVAIARAEVTKVRNNTSVAKVRPIAGEMTKPKEGDRVEPKF